MAAKRARAAAAAVVEALEARRVLSVSLGADGVLTVTGTAGADVVVIGTDAHEAGRVHVRLNWGGGTFDLSAVREIRVDCGAGDDEVRFDNHRGVLYAPTVIDCGAGDDWIDAQDNRDAHDRILVARWADMRATVLGGDGRDSIFGGTGADLIDGGAGDDLLMALLRPAALVGVMGQTTVYGGEGDDVVINTVDSSEPTPVEVVGPEPELELELELVEVAVDLHGGGGELVVPAELVVAPVAAAAPSVRTAEFAPRAGVWGEAEEEWWGA
jgi:Ca2+-binding RTX toxin-like protein